MSHDTNLPFSYPIGRIISSLKICIVVQGSHVKPLLNHYRSYRQIYTIGEMDCPTPKRFNSPLTQNPFRILERILSNN